MLVYTANKIDKIEVSRSSARLHEGKYYTDYPITKDSNIDYGTYEKCYCIFNIMKFWDDRNKRFNTVAYFCDIMNNKEVK